MRLLAIGLAAGFFSALLGVGGGLVVVPLLILLVGFRSGLPWPPPLRRSV